MVNDIQWDHEADVVIIGGGTAGLPAAIRLRERCQAAAVLEWRPQCGGSLTLAQQEAMTRRAQAQAGRLFTIPGALGGVGLPAAPGPPAAPVRSLVAPPDAGSMRQGRGFTVGCGSALAAMLVGSGLIVALVWVGGA